MDKLIIPKDSKDMKAWAKSFGSLDYSILSKFLYELFDELLTNANIHFENVEYDLGDKVLLASEMIFEAYFQVEKAWEIFLNKKKL